VYGGEQEAKKEEWRIERDVGFWGGHDEKEGKKKGLAKLQECPSSNFFLVPSWLIIDITSLIRNPYSKPKLII